MNDVLLMIILSLVGVTCPHVQSECAELYFHGVNIATCYGDTMKPPVTLPCDAVTHVDLSVPDFIRIRNIIPSRNI